MQNQDDVGIRIVQADLNDPIHQVAVVELLDEYARDRMGGNEPLPVEVRNRLMDALRAHPTTRVLLAFEGKRAIGVAVCFLGFSTFAARPLLNVHDLAVDPPMRGHGVGRQLLVEAEAMARRLGCCKITLEVREDNRVAQHLYDDCGFVQAGVGGVPMLLREKYL